MSTWLLSAVVSASTPSPLTVDSFFDVSWLRKAQISPDGKYAALAIAKHDEAANRTPSKIYLYDVGTKELKPFSKAEASEPAWAVNSEKVYFIADGSSDNEPQLWSQNIAGGEAQELTHFCGGVSTPVVSPSGRYIALFSELYPECGRDLDCQCKTIADKKLSKSTGKVYDSLLFRHWNHWRDAKRSHLVLFDTQTGILKDLTPGNFDVPPIDLGGAIDVAFSPDEKYIAYTSNHDKVVAMSTNNDIFITDLNGENELSIPHGPGNDNNPQFSPDGRYLAYISMARAGFEADLSRLMVMDLQNQEIRQLVPELDRPVTDFVWAPNGKGIYFIAMNEGTKPLYYADFASGKAQIITKDQTYSKLSMANDGTIALIGQDLANPAELIILEKANHNVVAQTTINKSWKETVILPKGEVTWFKGAKGEQVQTYFLPAVNPRDPKHVPLVVLVHGGPQGVFGDDFHPRWNAQLYAARGYTVAMINFHGSVGYGQAFTDSISKNWGSYPFEDVMKGLEDIIAKHPEINGQKVCASGGSYGGYMMNWIAGHTDRFSCLISHAGVYNLTSKYGSTEELWFPEWEFGGNPYDNPKLYKKWSPHNYVKNFKTPTLVIHGSNDFRVPLEQGLQMYTALQRKEVPSKLLIFTDEDHFVRKPQNIRVWWNTIHEWLDTYLQ